MHRSQSSNLCLSSPPGRDPLQAFPGPPQPSQAWSCPVPMSPSLRLALIDKVAERICKYLYDQDVSLFQLSSMCSKRQVQHFAGPTLVVTCTLHSPASFFQLAAMLLPSPPRLLESQEQHNSTEASDWPRRSRGESERCDWWKVSWYRLGSRGRVGAGRATCACAPAPAGCVRPAHAQSNTFSNFKSGILYQDMICGAWTYFFRPDNNAVI